MNDGRANWELIVTAILLAILLWLALRLNTHSPIVFPWANSAERARP